jgi:hypothetical protein
MNGLLKAAEDCRSPKRRRQDGEPQSTGLGPLMSPGYEFHHSLHGLFGFDRN